MKIGESSLDCIHKLIAHDILQGEVNTSGGPEFTLLAELIDSVCKGHELNDDTIEL